MTVYKGYMKIIKQNKGIMSLYLVIFFAITIMFQGLSKGENQTGYQAERVRVGVTNEDGGTAAQAFCSYLETIHDVTLMENKPEVLQENLFYRNVEYIIRIPENFFERCIEDGEKLFVTKVPGSYTSFYVDQQINSYLNSARTYYAAGFTVEEAAEAAAEIKTADVRMLDISGNGGDMPAYGFYFRYMPYLFLAVLCYVMGNVLSSFRKGDLPKRMQASAISGRRQGIEGLLAAGTVGLGLWILAVGVALIMYGRTLIQSSGFFYYLMNGAAMMVVALALAYLVGLISKDFNMLNGIVNVLSLGMCFLGGVFVPLDLISSNVQRISAFLPVYWYEKAIEQLVDYGDITGNVRVEIMQCIGIQLVFAAAFACLALVISKRRQSI